MLAAELAKHAPVSYTSVISRNEKEIESRSNLLKDLMTPEIKERLIKFVSYNLDRFTNEY